MNAIPNFEGIDKFFERYDLGHCYSALLRIKEGNSGWNRNDGGQIVDVVSSIINCKDTLELGVNEVNRVFPSLLEIQAAFSKF